jgi:hypothetical protein
MSVTASIFSVVLFLAFAMAGIQKVRWNPMMSGAAEHLGFTKSAYQRIGMLEIAGAIGVIVGVAANGSSFWGVLNEAAAAGLALTMLLAVIMHIRKGDNAKMYAPALVLGVIALLELILRAS